MKTPSGRKKARRRKGSPSVRLPLPKKREARHGDLTKYDRAREKERLRKQIRAPEGIE
jgi:hypothetical protein